MTLIPRRLNVDATSWRCIDVEPTLYKRHVTAGNLTQLQGALVGTYSISNKIASVPNAQQDKAVHLRRLIRVFAVPPEDALDP